MFPLTEITGTFDGNVVTMKGAEVAVHPMVSAAVTV